MPTEIERKWRLSSCPKAEPADQFEVHQAYLTEPENYIEVRVRKIEETRLLTIKIGQPPERPEFEFSLSKKLFRSIWKHALHKLVKTRREYVVQSGLLEVDQFYNGLYMGEVEFRSSESAEEFEPPSWFGEEVTTDPRFKNAHIAKHGPPRKS